MKLNEKNIDSWLKGNLNSATSPVEEALLETILTRNNANNRKRILIFWVNVLMIAAWVVFYANYRTKQFSMEESRIETEINKLSIGIEKQLKINRESLLSPNPTSSLNQSLKLNSANENPIVKTKLYFQKLYSSKDKSLNKDESDRSFDSTEFLTKPILNLYLIQNWVLPSLSTVSIKNFQNPITQNPKDSSKTKEA